MQSKWLKARKKPVTVEFRDPVPDTIAYIDKKGIIYTGYITPELMKRLKMREVNAEEVPTLEGITYAIPGIDYVIKGVKGELYPIKITIFHQTYDMLEEA